MELCVFRRDTEKVNALVLWLSKSRRTDLSLEVFEMMIEKGYMPSETTYTILVEGIIREEERELAAAVLKELHQRQVVSRSTVERIVMQYDIEELSI